MIVNYNYMIYAIITLLPFIFTTINTLGPIHDFYYDSNYYPHTQTRTKSTFRSKSTTNNDNAAGFIISVLFILIIATVVYYICKRCRSSQVPAPLPIYPVQPPYLYNQPYYVNQFEPNPPMNNSYPTHIYPQNFQYNSRIQSNWLGPDYSASRKLKQNCDFCRMFSRYGQEPRVMLTCQQRHTFHLFCVNQHRAGANRLGSNTYVSNTCPICNVVVQERILFFCMLCKEKNVGIDLKEFSDQHGVIDLTKLFAKYGEYCQSCRRM